jgi:excisionase family DNA binding protein
MHMIAVPNELLSVNDVSAKLKVHPRKLRRMAREGGIPALKVGSDWRFDWKAVLAYLTEKAGNRAMKESV